MGRVFAVIFGFIAASLAAGVSMVLFVYTPSELLGDMDSARFAEAALLALAAATHSAIFAAPFALIGALFGESRTITSIVYYGLVGLLIALLGFLVQYVGEARGEASIFNTYALVAFVVTGLVSGLVYWYVAGRFAGGPQAHVLEAVVEPRPMPGPKSAPPTDIAHSPS